MRLYLLFGACLLCAQAPPTPAKYQLTPEDRSRIEHKSAELESALRPLRARVPDEDFVDAEVYLKAAQFALRFDEFYTAKSVDQTLKVLDRGLERTRQLAKGDATYATKPGVYSRAYRSRVDGSVQPYSVTIPENYDRAYLDVILHGRGATLNEVSFLASHDSSKPGKADRPYIKLDVYGRANNAYRWAGETDVFEAIASVRKRYRIEDSTHITLRGFSMGGAGAWHLGLHYPDMWTAVEAGAGFVETKVHGNVKNPPPYAHIYDVVDYALNVFNTPTVGYGGEDDPQLRASVFVREALQREGYRFDADGLDHTTNDLRALFLVGPKTKHMWHPASLEKSEAFLRENQAIMVQPKVRFVTYTERYNRCFLVTVDQLEKQYERAQVDTESDPEHSDVKVTTRNVARLSLTAEPSQSTFAIDGQKLPAKDVAHFERADGKWRVAQETGALRKKHGLQGPIDDAFMDAFLCVRPSSGTSPELDRFAQEFAHWMRGDVRIKSDRELTAADVRDHNIIAFGTPATNSVIQRALAGTPARWTKESIQIAGRTFDAATHSLSMIYPNPSNRNRYLVINSGHTFHEKDYLGTNALLYPRVGDWAVTDTRTGEVVAEGVFDRNWK